MVPALDRLVEALCRLPTIGRKSAWRLALFMLERPQDELRDLADAVASLKANVRLCVQCFSYSEHELCSVCSSPVRDGLQICVVEKSTDVMALEKSGRFHGLYHVLGGSLSPINGITVDKLRIAELVQRIDRTQPHELIIGLGASTEAETTALYLARLLAEKKIKITRFARGIPAGTELEYVDQLTLTQALHERSEIVYR